MLFKQPYGTVDMVVHCVDPHTHTLISSHDAIVELLFSEEPGRCPLRTA